MNRNIATALSLMREGRINDGVELLYKKCYAQMYGIAFSVLKNENDSRDAVHNAIAVLLSISTEKLPHTNELGWLYTVIKNEALDLWKRNQRLLPLSEDFLLDEADEDREISAILGMDSYMRMISSLDSTRQQVVTLKVLGGFTHREIGEILGKPTGTVQWLYSTAILRLKAAVTILSVITLLASAETVRRVIGYINISSGGPTDTPGEGLPPIDVPDGGLPPPWVPPVDGIFDPWIVIFGIIALLGLGVLIFGRFKKTDNK